MIVRPRQYVLYYTETTTIFSLLQISLLETRYTLIVRAVSTYFLIVYLPISGIDNQGKVTIRMRSHFFHSIIFTI